MPGASLRPMLATLDHPLWLGVALHRRPDRRAHGGERPPLRADRRVPVRAVGGASTRPRSWSGSPAATSPSAAAFAAAFALVACFPAISFLMALLVVREAPARPTREGFGETAGAVREALRRRDLWVVAGFIFFWTFSPSFGPAFFYYETDVLGFSQSSSACSRRWGPPRGVAGAWAYAPPVAAVLAQASDRLVHRRRAWWAPSPIWSTGARCPASSSRSSSARSA